ncbi:cyclase [Mycobacterium intermedium]|uniref:Cyclase n=1 Tax=Mycobacterium intermedium TaxID=28445 RepID=A0A1E3SFB7_MYCIE|nr:adenylate/guanylate cyclase domain-containing protein [Mycobacterium intermedium]MCV6966661.1 AAA family ATPase [Mycobacterium intermedium]ODR00820.1 cyclase [Mycobacterium intermedium]OPE52139.1 cyclase [Mycobacterium intermedium]ORB10573.1 cyclase [Mycobacterium intermedium]
MTAGVVCGSCGTRLRDNAKYCDECGAPVAIPEDAAQYKQVTVLFADVVRSMDMAATLDIERLREIMTELVERSATVVRRYGGTAEYNGDGVMALFGAPIALEDHANRACLAALSIQQEADRLAAEVARRDGMALRLRVGLNSGRVIAGEIGSGTLGYAATGKTVGLAQRMESVAPPGAVMLSESTARLVEHAMLLSQPESMRIKGFDEPIYARRLLAIRPRRGLVDRAEASRVGRRWEMAALEAMVDRAISGRGGVVTVVGPPGIGKSRAAREVAALAVAREVEVFWAFCESHATEVPFYAVTRLLRASLGMADLSGQAARARMRQQFPDADPQDLALLNDLLGVSDPDVPLPQIDPDARRRRLTGLINTASLARTQPALYVIEDAHWIDAVSESMLADFLSVVSRAPSMVLITARPEYTGALAQVRGAQTIALAPLSDSDIETLLGELLGSDPSVSELAGIIVERAAGNPFFAEEMVRELVQREVLAGEPGAYHCHTAAADVSVPATVQAAIEARIDRLDVAAKRALTAASVIGARFDAELLTALGIDAAIDMLLDAELIDQVRFTPSAEYAFRHPLIRAVAYESLLKTDRAQWHRRLATAIQEREPDAVEDNAALIAEHLTSAGELRDAYGWHMRAAASSANRDVNAARTNWERALRVAENLPTDGSAQLSMRIAPITMLCVTDWQARAIRQGRFAELRELCTATGDKVSLAIGMTGEVAELLYGGRSQASRVASEQMTLLESIGDPNLTVGLAVAAFAAWFSAGEFGEISRWSQRAIDLARTDPTTGAGFGLGWPVAATMAWRGVARWWLGHPGWRHDLDDALAMSRASQDPATVAGVIAWTYGLGLQYGALRVQDGAVRAIEDAVQIATGSSSDLVLSLAEYTLSVALLNSDSESERRRGLELMMQVRETCLDECVLFLIPVTELWIARDKAISGDRDSAISMMRRALDELHRAGGIAYGVWGTGLLVETLRDRGARGDLAEILAATDRLTELWADDGSAMREIVLLRLRSLAARARGDDGAYRDLASCYRAAAESLGFEGHTDWAEAMLDVE